jgi:hypothetical protein
LYNNAPRKKSIEHFCTGQLYKFITHAATIGIPKNRKETAKFFCSYEINEDKITNLKTTQVGKNCIRIQRRKKWIDNLSQN